MIIILIMSIMINCLALQLLLLFSSFYRFGGWCYEVSNQDYCFRSGIELIDKIFLGIPETVYQLGNT